MSRIDPEKVKRAASHPDRPGEECRAEPGAWKPRIDQTKCEGKGDCVQVCPYNVFEVRRIDEADYKSLGWVSRFKVRVHGMKMAYVPRADACRACGLCVVACPEDAIRIEELEPLEGAK